MQKRGNGLHLAGIGLPLVAGSALAALGAIAYAHEIEPKWLDVNPVTLRLPHLSPEFDGYRIAQFSDLHMELWRDWDMLARIVDETNAFEPDVVIITGDFVDRDGKGTLPQMGQALARLRPREVSLAVMGNHDHWLNADRIRRMLAKSGILDVSNEVYTSRRGKAMLHIAGLDSFVEYESDFDYVLNCLPEDGAAILAVHEPDFAFISAPTHRFDLQLSGHSHGGQIRLPFLTNWALPEFGRHFMSGLGELDGMYVYTNRGVGVSGVRARFLARPELTLFTLYSGHE